MALKAALPAGPRPASHSWKLRLMMAGGFDPLIRFWIAIRPPKVEVSAQVAITIAALGAAALAHSASRIASPSSPFTPGSKQFVGPEGGAGWTVFNEAPVKPDKPNVERNVVQSLLAKRSVSSIRYMVWFWPVLPPVNIGLKL